MKQFDSNTIGRRIHFFRKRENMSQLELETAIDAAPGSVSRIESGKTNPSKETLVKIGNALHLNIREFDYLDGLTSNPPTDTEVASAKEATDEYFSKRRIFAYLLDERWRFHAFSNFFKQVFNFTEVEESQVLGKTTVQVIVDESLPILKHLSKKHLPELWEHHFAYYYGQTHFMQDDESFQNTVNDIKKNAEACKVWQNVTHDSYNHQNSRRVVFTYSLLNKKIDVPMLFSRETLLDHSRFEVVEYYPQSTIFNKALQAIK